MNYLAGGFAAVWFIIFLYILSIARRKQALARQIESLRGMSNECQPKDRKES
jgi:CcmD family protein